ncbi:MAG: hypothetical protein HY291_23360 [Planctomycetes bacterium]|nr:hypothetical protein [Planctomycetota bacterium]
MDNLSARLDAVERKNRILISAVVLLTVAVGTLVALRPRSSGGAIENTKTAELPKEASKSPIGEAVESKSADGDTAAAMKAAGTLVEAQMFVVCDKDGKRRAVLCTMKDGTPVLTFYDADGKRTATLGAGNRYIGLTFYAHGTLTARLGAYPTNGTPMSIGYGLGEQVLWETPLK